MPDQDRPLIIKKVTISGGDGHHGGAWKVAYADFVTAMMAFFLLMWLLNATSEDQRKGLADFFDPSLPISRASAGGAGMLSGDTIFVPPEASGSHDDGIRARPTRREEGEDLERLRLALREPDFTTAIRIEGVINRALQSNIATMNDSGTVTLRLDGPEMHPARLIAAIENLEVEPSRKARVVVDQRSGTIVLGDDVKISRVAISQGNLTIRINETPIASQPNPFAEGESLVLPRTEIEIDEGGDSKLALVNANVTLADLVDGLNALGIGPRDMIDILKALKTAGALHAELIVQ